MAGERSEATASEDRFLRYYVRMLKRHPVYRTCKKPLDIVQDAVPDAWRMATQRFRHWPTAVVVGAQKAGTTQLYAHMVKHPRIFGGARKEIDYFSIQRDRSVEWYRSRFPFEHRVKARRGHVLEASPAYLCTPAALWQMRTVLPEARVIALLRDPVARAFSHYQHRKTRRKELRPFEEVVADELAKKLYPPKLGVALDADATPLLDFVVRGYYALQLELLFKLYPRDRVLVIDSAELFADTNGVCQRVFDFLGVESFDVQPSKVYNFGYYREKIDAGLAEQLREHYRPYDALLAEMMGTEFSWMAGQRATAA